LLDRQRALRQPRGQRLALEQFHDEKLDLIVPPDVEERADVWMRELRDRARFALESLARFRRRGEIAAQHLDRDEAVEPGVPCFVDGAHSAFAQLREHMVRTQRLADHRGEPRWATARPRRSSARSFDTR
jgi:hypothetical protein